MGFLYCEYGYRQIGGASRLQGCFGFPFIQFRDKISKMGYLKHARRS